LQLIGLGGIGLCLWQGRGRWLSLVPMLAALVLWQVVDRPGLLISPSGGLVGTLTGEGRALSRPRGDGFVATVWLENDGDAVTQDVAAARAGWTPEGDGVALEIGTARLWAGSGVAAARTAEAACASHDVIVLNEEPEGAGPLLEGAEARTLARLTRRGPSAAAAQADPLDGCLMFSPSVLARTGAVAISADGGALVFDTARAHQGDRLWSSR
jgi:competence protein ComEC